MTEHNQVRLAELIRSAGRAPSAHNTQPWSPRIAGDAVEVAVVPSRTLPAGDPTFRDLVLSLGCWVESFAICADAAGLDAVVEPLPALAALEELPVTGGADASRPVLRIHVSERSDARNGAHGSANSFTPADVAGRRVYRGRLRGRNTSFRELAAVPLPTWLTLRRLDDRAMAHLSRLGIAFTASRRSVAEELLHWLRLSPAHPRYGLDGMTDRMLDMAAPLARGASPFTRYASLRDPVVAVGGALGRMADSLWRDTSLPPYEQSLAVDAADAPAHVILVANTSQSTGSDSLSRTEAMDSRIGVPDAQALDAGRILQRLWLRAHTAGLVVSPHSEIIDSPTAHGVLRRRLSLKRADVALAVFSVGEPMGPVPVSPRLTDTGIR